MFLPQRNNETNWAWWWHFWYSAFVRLPSSTTISCKLVVKSGEFIDSYTVDSSRDETMENPEVFSPFLWEMHGRRRRILFTTSYGWEGGREGPFLLFLRICLGRRKKWEEGKKATICLMSLLLLPSYFSSSELRNFGSLSLSAEGGKNAGSEERWIFMEQNIPSLSLSFFPALFGNIKFLLFLAFFVLFVAWQTESGWWQQKNFFPLALLFFLVNWDGQTRVTFAVPTKTFLLVDDRLLFSQIVVHKYQRFCPS